ELCGWGRIFATKFTFGVGMGVPGTPMPDLEHAGCMLFWGYNPSLARIAHATTASAALRRGARLIVVDPRRAGLASKADAWLRVRPGSDGAPPRGRGAELGCSPPRWSGEQGGRVAPREAGKRRGARPGDRPCHDRARMVRSCLRPRLDERRASGPVGKGRLFHRGGSLP